VHHGHQIPAIGQIVTHIAHDMVIAAIVGAHHVARNRIMAQRAKRPTHHARPFASDQNARHYAAFFIMATASRMRETAVAKCSGFFRCPKPLACADRGHARGAWCP
jgi:hypothetical protein